MNASIRILVVTTLAACAAVTPKPEQILDSRAGDACRHLPDGQHVIRGPADQVIVSRTCQKGSTVGFCDVEHTRRDNRLSLVRCEDVGRTMKITGDLTMAGTFVARVGGVLPHFELATLQVGGTATFPSTFRIFTFLSGPFEPAPGDRFEILTAAHIDYQGSGDRISTHEGGSFRLDVTETSMVLTDYVPPADGWSYTPLLEMPN